MKMTANVAGKQKKKNQNCTNKGALNEELSEEKHYLGVVDLAEGVVHAR